MAVTNRLRPSYPLYGIVRAGKLTKELLRRCSVNEVLVIAHRDLDETAAIQLIDAKPIAVINTRPSLSGAYPAKGALQLLRAGVPLLEVSADDFDKFRDGEDAIIEAQAIRTGGSAIPCSAVTMERCARVFERAIGQVDKLLPVFIANTLSYAELEIADIVKKHECPPIHTVMAKRPVVAVSRGNGALSDLLVIGPFIRECKPVLIGVDGGADVLRKAGYSPDLIVGDMDSVSDAALQCGAELIVHAYGSGMAPGRERLSALSLHAHSMSTPGTSEDMALLLAHGAEAELIVTVGMHTHMVEFLEKGRSGMGSSLLVRMLLGSKLVDAKGLSRLIKPSGNPKLIKTGEPKLIDSVNLNNTKLNNPINRVNSMNTKLNNPVNPVNSTNTKLKDRINPLDPNLGNPVNLKLNNSINSVNSTDLKPNNPINPVKLINPVNPVNPVNPLNTKLSNPINPLISDNLNNPINPINSLNPGGREPMCELSFP